PTSPQPAKLTERLILPMLNEAVRCWREGVVDDPELLDAGVVFGTGFAPFTGGPLHYARSHGIDTIVGELTALTERYGERFEPDSGWQLLAQRTAPSPS
ncbi:MAG: 3-hydroxyacyl-CoA dehydrogenase family protein, partial [Pseudomonadota bacterium]